MLGVKSEGGGFQKLVWENVVDTLPGGLILDIDPANYPDGEIPEGTPVGKDPATGRGKAVTITPGTPDTYDYEPIGYTIRPVKAELNALVGVGLSGTIRKKALPTAAQAGADDLATVLPRITHV